MASLDQLAQLSNGSRFYRADLHIHSYGASHDVEDTTATPSAIVQEAVREKLDVIALTDHNDIRNVRAAIDAAKDIALYVMPAVELSTDSGHLLCYLPTVDVLEKFFAQLSIADKDKPNSRCQTSLFECLERLAALGGFGVLAHVDGPKGFEHENPGNSPHKVDVLCHRALLGIELKNSSSDISFSPDDPDTNRQQIGRERIQRLSLGSSQHLARLLNSDSHSIAALGRNAQGDRKITRIKMAQPSFASLRIALEDSDARVRIEDEIPLSVPHVEGLSIEGGFLDGVRIRFSRNLNCLIGGRGTGKSTTFEAVRCLTGQQSQSSIVDSEAWPSTAVMFWRDQAGQSHKLTRSHGGDLVNADDPRGGPRAFQIESYGQGETARISKAVKDNPLALLEYLDRFVDVAQVCREESDARDELLRLQEKVEEATANVEKIPGCKRDLQLVKSQLKALSDENAREIISLQQRLAQGGELRAAVVAKLREIKAALESQSVRATIDELVQLADPTSLPVGSSEFQRITEEAGKFRAVAIDAQEKTLAKYEVLREFVEQRIGEWKALEAGAMSTIESKKKALEAKGVRLDMAYIAKLAKNEAQLQANLTALNAWIPHLKELRAQYRAASSKRWAARDRIATMREAYAKSISALLKSALTDLTVSLKFTRSAYSPDMERLIIAAMEWRTSKIPRASILVQSLSAPGLLSALDKKDKAAITGIRTSEGAPVFDAKTAASIIENLSAPSVRFGLERAEVFDLPRLTVTKAVVDSSSGATKHITRDFSQLSLGQQQSTLLALMLSSGNDSPLIIDQPEDNLDGEFIYSSLVPVLRRAKERRQVIVVTHNANIAVLGDAELIVVLKSTSEKGVVTSRGSIDDPSTRTYACNILEGAQEAFARRARIYGEV